MSTRARIDDRNDRADREGWLEGRQARDRVDLVREAGWRQVSWPSVFAGLLTAIGTFTLCVGVAAAVIHPLGIALDDLTAGDWKRLGLIAGMAAAAALLGAFAFGGYVAGRMARRGGLRHGMLVFLVGAVVLATATGIAHFEDALSAVRERVESLGAPTGDSAWGGILLLTAVVALAGTLLGSLLGAVRGERWHQRLVSRAADPKVGPEAKLRADVEAQRKAAAKALAKARRAGVLTEKEERTRAETKTAAEPARSNDKLFWRDARTPTAAGRAMPPSSSPSGP
ncbi:MAG TPA: hypothetical protein VGK05_08890 [Acidimicrobiia bacterium]|jgi:hypothetical protein